MNPLSGMDIPTLISRTLSFPLVGVLGGIYLLFFFHKTYCKHTVKILTRNVASDDLIWISTVCLCPIKRGARLIWVKNMGESF